MAPDVIGQGIHWRSDFLPDVECLLISSWCCNMPLVAKSRAIDGAQEEAWVRSYPIPALPAGAGGAAAAAAGARAHACACDAFLLRLTTACPRAWDVMWRRSDGWPARAAERATSTGNAGLRQDVHQPPGWPPSPALTRWHGMAWHGAGAPPGNLSPAIRVRCARLL